MPELPEVETTRCGILPHIKNQTIVAVHIRNRVLRWPVPKQLARQCRQHTIHNVTRRGKYMIFHLSSGFMLVHLGMSGSMRIAKADMEVRKHDHIDWVLANAKILRYHDPRRFGSVHWIKEDPQQHFLLKDLGPEPLSKSFSADYLYKKSRGRKAAVKNFIMDAKIVVGVGNIYASEALFLAGIHPSRAAGQIAMPRYAKLVVAIQRVLRASIQQGGTTLRDFVNENGAPGYFRQQLQVYERADLSCGKCKANIQRKVIGQRASYYCPRCQR